MQTIRAKRLVYVGVLGITLSVLLGLLVTRAGNFLQEIDLSIYQTLYPPASTSFAALMLFISTFGSAPLVAIMSLVAIAVLSMRRRWLEVAVWISALGITELLTFILKNFFLRARPLLHLVEANGGSYPSGHAASATAFFLLAFFCLEPLLKDKTIRSLFSLSCFLLVGAVALSRLVLGAHWLSDTIGSFLLASGTVFFCYGAAQLMRQKSTQGLSFELYKHDP